MAKKKEIDKLPDYVECVKDSIGVIKTVKLNINPQPKQQEFFSATEMYVAYGGARGGGKSWSARFKALTSCLAYNDFKVLIVRKTYPELLANHIEPLCKDLSCVMADAARRADLKRNRAICCYNKEDKSLVFANGSKIVFGYCDNDDDAKRYQGQEYDFVFIDEATHFTEFQFQKLSEICRGINKYPKRIYLTCNPGGVGHGWVKRLFIERNYYENERPERYKFIPAFVDDNQILMKYNPQYKENLESLPEDIREADLNGNWDVYEGQYFKEFRNEIHVCDPYTILDVWVKYRSLDYGLDMLACYWHAVKPNGEAVTYRELHMPNLLPSEAAKLIMSNTPQNENIMFTMAPPDLWARTKDRGISIIGQFFESGLLNIAQADNNREAGWLDMKEWMKVIRPPDGEPYSRYTIFKSCTNLVKNIPLAQADEKNPSDIAKEPHNITHSLDAVRYFFRARPAPAQNDVKERTIYEQFFNTNSNDGDGYGETYDGYGGEI